VHQRNGRLHADYVNVAFILRDVTEADGGVRLFARALC
jgi:hypothetical protein